MEEPGPNASVHVRKTIWAKRESPYLLMATVLDRESRCRESRESKNVAFSEHIFLVGYLLAHLVNQRAASMKEVISWEEAPNEHSSTKAKLNPRE